MLQHLTLGWSFQDVCKNLSNIGWDELITLCNFCIWGDDWAHREMQEKWTHIFKIVIVYTTIQSFLFWKKLILLFSKNALNWWKVTVTSFMMLQKTSVSNLLINAVLLTFLFIKESWKKVSTKIFKIDNNKKKCFLSSKPAYYNDFWWIIWHRRLE